MTNANAPESRLDRLEALAETLLLAVQQQSDQIRQQGDQIRQQGRIYSAMQRRPQGQHC